MSTDYVTISVASGMRSIGFDERCNRFHAPCSDEGTNEVSGWIFTHISLDDEYIPAPLYRRAFRWFRDNHGLYPSIEIFSEKWISRWCHINGSMGAIATHDKYEDAEDACLMKFIEIVKEKQ